MNTNLKQIVLNDEYKNHQIRVLTNTHTFSRVTIFENGQFKHELQAKPGDAINAAKTYIDTIH